MDSHSAIDLHCHSTASDGTLSPAEVVARAAGQGVKVLALTDHDTVAGLGEAERAAVALGMLLVPAAELSCQWNGRDLHLVALGIDPANAALLHGMNQIRGFRERRLDSMGEKLQKRGISGMADAARHLAAGGIATRTHMARAMLEAGVVSNLQQAFDGYLKQGKAAWVKPEWPEMATVVKLINDAGGRAVVAHPLAYQMTGAWLRRTLTAFREAGGVAVEVVCGNTDRQRIDNATGQALRTGLQGSMGSDFHSPDNPWIELGRLRGMPKGVTPVWSAWPAVMARLGY